MARKKKQEKNCNIFCALLITMLILGFGFFAWIARYELFPNLIKDGVMVCFLTQNGEDKLVKYSYNDSSKVTRFNYSITKLIEGPSNIQKLFKVYSEK